MGQQLFRHPRVVPGMGLAPVTGLVTEGGRIVATGEASELAEQFPGAIPIDLDGAVVVPGFYDAHLHSGHLARDLDAVDLRGASGITECQDRLRAHLTTAGDDQDSWVVGGRWDANRWTDGAVPHRRALDHLSNGRPVLLKSIDGHSSWLNSEALRRAGIDASTPDIDGGVIERDPDGAPTGVLREQAAGPADAVLARERTEDLAAILARAQNHLLSLGLTSIHDIDGEDIRSTYLKMRKDGTLNLRVHKAIQRDALAGAIEQGRHTGDGDDWISTGPVKLFSDGALGSHSCLMTQPFAGQNDNTGVAVTGHDELVELSRTAVRAGIAVATHAIGDAANRTVLDVYSEIAADNHRRLRLRIEHAQYLQADDVARAARLGAVASMQPTHCTTDWALADRMLAGHDVVAYGWQSMLRAGVPLAFGSDAPVESADPLRGLYAAVTRTDAAGNPQGGWRGAERLTVQQALHAFTVGSAYAAGTDDRSGQLLPGMFADFVVIDSDVLTGDPEILRSATVLTTVVGGVIRWQHPAPRSLVARP